MAGALAVFARSAREALAAGVAARRDAGAGELPARGRRAAARGGGRDDRMLISRRMLDVAYRVDGLRAEAESAEQPVPIESLVYDAEPEPQVVPIESLAPDSPQHCRSSRRPSGASRRASALWIACGASGRRQAAFARGLVEWPSRPATVRPQPEATR